MRKSMLSYLTEKPFPSDRDVSYLRCDLSCVSAYKYLQKALRNPHIKVFVRSYSLSPHLQEKQIIPDDFSVGSANQTFALGGYLNITVQQYFFLRHKMRLVYPNLPLVSTLLPSGHVEYYPIECLDVEIPDDDEITIIKI